MLIKYTVKKNKEKIFFFFSPKIREKIKQNKTKNIYYKRKNRLERINSERIRKES
jgi:hypothetical protein